MVFIQSLKSYQLYYCFSSNFFLPHPPQLSFLSFSFLLHSSFSSTPALHLHVRNPLLQKRLSFSFCPSPLPHQTSARKKIALSQNLVCYLATTALSHLFQPLASTVFICKIFAWMQNCSASFPHALITCSWQACIQSFQQGPRQHLLSPPPQSAPHADQVKLHKRLCVDALTVPPQQINACICDPYDQVTQLTASVISRKGYF